MIGLSIRMAAAHRWTIHACNVTVSNDGQALTLGVTLSFGKRSACDQPATLPFRP